MFFFALGIPFSGCEAEFFAASYIESFGSFLCEVLQTQPTERGVRPTGPYAIYEMDGKEYTLAYGKNGYIVSFYPKC